MLVILEKNYMCNRCLHIIKTNQQIGWGHQYTQTLHYGLVPNVKNFAYNYIMKEIYLNQSQILDEGNKPTNPFTNPLH